jgi:hypothetical protein
MKGWVRFECVFFLFLLKIPTVATTTSSTFSVSASSIEKVQDKSVDKPDWLIQWDRNDPKKGSSTSCGDNAIVLAWCDDDHNKELQCGMSREYDEYGCVCYDHPSLCPTECVEGTMMIQKTHHSIRCQQIPLDETPNYDIIHPQQPVPEDSIVDDDIATIGCDNNLLVASWCDDKLNPHLTCRIKPQVDTYECHCSGKMAFCPFECIHQQSGQDNENHPPIERTTDQITCAHIPMHQPNYILK